MLIIFFIIGLMVGSFLNVVIYRLNLLESVMGRSHCPSCKKKIRWYDNVPVLSFVILGMKCRDCGDKISWQYPAVEILTGAVFALVGNYFFFLNDPQSWITAFFYLAIFSSFIVISVYDFKYMEVPMLIVWLGIGAAVVYYLYFDWINFSPQTGLLALKVYSGTLAGFAAFMIFFLFSAGSREKLMGMGDAYVAMLAGALTGWPNIFWALMLAFSAGAIYGIILIMVGRKTMKSQVPFAPFLAIGTTITIFIFQAVPYVKHLLRYY